MSSQEALHSDSNEPKLWSQRRKVSGLHTHTHSQVTWLGHSHPSLEIHPKALTLSDFIAVSVLQILGHLGILKLG